MSSDVRGAYALPEGLAPTDFETACGLTPVVGTEGEYTAELQPDWCIGVVPHGGYLASVLLTASTAYFITTLSHLSQPDPIHSHITYSTRCVSGPATLTVKPLKIGRGFSVVTATLSQSSTLCITAHITHSNLASETGFSLAVPLTPLPPRSSCVEYPDPSAFIRHASSKLRYFWPKEAAKGEREPWELVQWVTREDGGLITIQALGYLSDMFVPLLEGTEGVGGKSWYPTLSIGLEVKQAPKGKGWEWVGMKVNTKVFRNSRMDIDVLMVDEEGEVIALSRHVALVVPLERNRKREEKL